MCELRDMMLYGACPRGHHWAKATKKKICWPKGITDNYDECTFASDAATQQDCIKHVGFPKSDRSRLVKEPEGFKVDYECQKCKEKQKNQPQREGAMTATEEAAAKWKSLQETVNAALATQRKKEAATEGYEDINMHEAEEELRGNDTTDLTNVYYEPTDDDDLPNMSAGDMIYSFFKKGLDRVVGN